MRMESQIDFVLAHFNWFAAGWVCCLLALIIYYAIDEIKDWKK